MLKFSTKINSPIEVALRKEAGTQASAVIFVQDYTLRSVITVCYVGQRRLLNRKFRLAKNGCKTVVFAGHEIKIHNLGRKGSTIQLGIEGPEVVRLWRFGFKGNRD